MARLAVALISGLLFGLGLSLSEMVNPVRVLGFLDLGGRWDPTLLFVMAGALAVAFPAFPIILKRGRPVLVESFELPTKTELDPRLLAGSAIFGVGWGLVGFCPGPAIAALATGRGKVFGFALAMAAGMELRRRFAS